MIRRIILKRQLIKVPKVVSKIYPLKVRSKIEKLRVIGKTVLRLETYENDGYFTDTRFMEGKGYFTY